MNNIRFEKFTEKHIDAAIELTLKELAAEKKPARLYLKRSFKTGSEDFLIGLTA